MTILGTLQDRVNQLSARLQCRLPGHGGRGSLTFVPTAHDFLVFSCRGSIFCRAHNGSTARKRIRCVRLSRLFGYKSRKPGSNPGSLRFHPKIVSNKGRNGGTSRTWSLYDIFAMGLVKGSEAKLFVILTVPAVIEATPLARLVIRVRTQANPSWVLDARDRCRILSRLSAPSRGVGVSGFSEHALA